MKILYVEDELERNIPRLLILFDKYLTETQKRKLTDLETDNSGFGADPKIIQDIVNTTGVVECYSSFVDAVERSFHHEEFCFYIVDRNLVNSNYDFTAVRAVDATFTEQLYEAFFEREGDYLLQKLIFNHVDVANCFYFLTAYGANDEIRNSHEVKTLIDFGKFKQQNFIEKGNEYDLKRLQMAMKASPNLFVYTQNMKYLHILKKNIDNDTANRFHNILMELENPDKISSNIGCMRYIYQIIMESCIAFWPDMTFINDKGEVVFFSSSPKFGGPWIDALQKSGRINTIQFYYFMCLWRIGSEFGAHPSKKEEKIYSPTLETVYALCFALKDTILWFEKIRPKKI